MRYVNDGGTCPHRVRDNVQFININLLLTTGFLERNISIYSVVRGLSLISKIRNTLNSAFCGYKRKKNDKQK